MKVKTSVGTCGLPEPCARPFRDLDLVEVQQTLRVETWRERDVAGSDSLNGSGDRRA
jgi:hypothetical protein